MNIYYTSVSCAPRQSYNNNEQDERCRRCCAPPWPLPALFTQTCNKAHHLHWKASKSFCSAKHIGGSIRQSRIWNSLIGATVMLTSVWTMCLLWEPEKMQVYVPECSSSSGLLSRRDPSPCGRRSWSSSARPSHWFSVCLLLLSYLTITLGSLVEAKVQVREKFWSLCGAVQGMNSGRPSSCVKSYKTKTKTHIVTFYLSIF